MKSILSCIFLLLAGAAMYILVLKGIPGNVRAADLKDNTEYSLRDRGRYLLVQKLVENRSFVLTRSEADLAAPDAGYYKGSWFLLYPPGISVLAIPFYSIGSMYDLSLVTSFAMGAVFGIGILLVIFFVARQILHFPYWASILAALIFGFSSTALGYTTSLFQHHATAFFILASFYAVWRYKKHRRWGFLWGIVVWASYAIAIFIDYPNALLMLPVMVYFALVSVGIKKENEGYSISLRPAFIVTAIFFVSLTFLHGYYNYIHFGSFTKVSGSLPDFRAGVDKIVDTSKDAASAQKKINEVLKKKKVGSFFKEDHVVNGAYELLLSIDRGLLVFSPIFSLGFLGMFLSRRQLNLEKWTLIGIVGFTLFLYASWSDPYGGWAYGPRYLIPALPPLSIFVSYFLVHTKHKIISKLVAFVLIVISSAISVLGAVTTNAVPPKTEADWLHAHYGTNLLYGIAYAYDYLVRGQTSSYIYSNFLTYKISLIEYYAIVFGSACVVVSLVFLMPIGSALVGKFFGRKKGYAGSQN